MSNNQELEKIVGQLKDLPGHILGLDGWLLRTLPKDKREIFLKGFEKLIRVVYFPDHAPDARSKSSREQYIQAVSNAVTYLTSDEFAYELAVEEVPTEKNPIVKLKTEMEQKEREHQRETLSLSQKIDSTSKEIENTQRVNQELRRVNTLELGRTSILLRVQEHNRIYLSQNRCYDIRNRRPFSISGYFLDFNKIRGMDALQTIILGDNSGLKTKYANFQEILESNLLSGTKENLRFQNRTAPHGDYFLRILGGLTIGSIKEFITYKNLLRNTRKDVTDISPGVFMRDMSELPNTTLSITREGYQDDIRLSHFSIPALNIGLPILVRETRKMSIEYLPKKKKSLPQKKNSLFYVMGVNLYS